MHNTLVSITNIRVFIDFLVKFHDFSYFQRECAGSIYKMFELFFPFLSF